MKPKLFLLALIIQQHLCIAQVYHPLLNQNKNWEFFDYDASTICGTVSAEHCFMAGDTLISGQVYKKIGGCNIVNLCGCPYYCGPFALDNNSCNSYGGGDIFMREDTINKKVFVYHNNGSGGFTEDLLYDFSLSNGDTLNTQYGYQGMPIIIDSVSPVMLNTGSIRNKFYVSTGQYYIESIGSSQGLFYPLTEAIGYFSVLTCVNENNISLFGNCLGIVGIETLENEATKFVNTTSDFSKHIFEIKIENNQNGLIEVFNSQGQNIYKEKLRETDAIINLNSFSSDLYIYKYESNQSGIVTGKIQVIN